MRFIFLIVTWWAGMAWTAGLAWTAGMACAQAAKPNYQDDIVPIFRQHCLGCHNADKKEADLDLSSLASIKLGSSGGAVVKAGLPDSSPLYLAVNHDEDHVPMPPNKPKIEASQRTAIHDWIEAGLLATADGTSDLREVSFDVKAGSMERPAEPAFPINLPPRPLNPVVRTPPVTALDCSPWSHLIAAAGHREILLFESRARGLSGSPLIGTIPFPEGDIHDLRFSRNGELLIAAGGMGARSGRVAIYDVKTGRPIATVGNENDIVLSADLSADHKWVAIGTTTKMVKIHSSKDGKLAHRIAKHTDWVTTVRFSPDGSQLATADRNGGIHVWETDNAGIVYTLDEHKVKVNALAWRSDGAMLASADEDGKLVLWDMKDGWATRSITAHQAEAASRYSRRTGVTDVAFGRDGRLLTVGRDRKVRLWNTDGTPVSSASMSPQLPLCVQFGADGKTAFVGSFDGRIRAWDVSTMKPIGTLEVKRKAAGQDTR